MEFSGNVGDLSYFSTPLPGCLCRVSFRRYSPLSLEVVEETEQSSFWAEATAHIFSYPVSNLHSITLGFSSDFKPGSWLTYLFAELGVTFAAAEHRGLLAYSTVGKILSEQFAKIVTCV